MQARKKFFENGGADFAPGPFAAILFIGPHHQPPKSRKSWKSWWAGGGGGGGGYCCFILI